MGHEHYVFVTQQLFEHGVARPAGRGLRAVTGRIQRNALLDQRHAQPGTQRPAVRLPLIGLVLQLVVHVHGSQSRRVSMRLPMRPEQVQQHSRIHTATQRHIPVPGAGVRREAWR